jgi:hypothetical protein
MAIDFLGILEEQIDGTLLVANKSSLTSYQPLQDEGASALQSNEEQCICMWLCLLFIFAKLF